MHKICLQQEDPATFELPAILLCKMLTHNGSTGLTPVNII